jgi:2-polyprenyl-6-methoxyphenol hydroxylase-like FAD-dependent oxidoreductase
MLTSAMNVELVQGTCARFFFDQGRVRGVKSEAGVDLEADLVVDASGRGSQAPRWLADGGFEPPRETTVNAFLGYASRFYRPAPDPGRWWKGMYIQSAPPESPRVGVILPIEGGLWHVTLGGGDRQYPPADERGFEEFARSLRSPALADALRDAEPLSPIHVTRSTHNRQRHFEAIRMPDGFVVTGDATCAFNPVYGQGMTTAALGAVTLAESLRDTAAATGLPQGDGLPRRFQRGLARVNAVPWTLAVGEDLRYRSTEGARAGFGTRVSHRYMNAVGRLTTIDTRVRLALLRAFHLVAPPSSLFAPRIMWSVVRNQFDGSDASRTSVQTRARAPIV